jgi:photosystem II stability/assembly factor-like uncharacterized protein
MKTICLLFLVLFTLSTLSAQIQDWPPTWQNTKHTYYGWASFPDSVNGWVVGYEGSSNGVYALIDRTTNGGYAWTRQYTGVLGTDITSVHFFDALNGWASGANGMLLKTTNGGTSWLTVPTGTSLRFNGMHWLNSNVGWLATTVGANVLRTTNGGATWATSNTGAGFELSGIYFVNSTTGWVSGDGGTIRKTTDGGITWNAQSSGVGTNINLRNPAFLDSLTGWVVGGNYDTIPVILKTTNGGQNWTQQTSPIRWHLMCVRFLNANQGCAVGWQGTVITTTNGGSTWLPSPRLHVFPGAQNLTCLFFRSLAPNDYKGWICGSGLEVYSARFGLDAVPESGGLPREFSLSQNYPNPFNPSTTIGFQMSQRENAQVNIYNSIGQLLRILVNDQREPGTHTVVWDGKDNSGNFVASGSYFYQVQVGDMLQTKKMLLLK